MVNIIMHGCCGQMGKMIASLAAQDEEIRIIAGVDVFDDGKSDFPVFSRVLNWKVQANRCS